MRISYRYNFLFIHIDRTGGTSISKALGPYSYHTSDLERLYAAVIRRLGLPESYRWRKFPTQHMKADELKSWVPQKKWDQMFKFAFVRNPWDWLLSIYFARLQHPVHPEYELARYLGSFDRYVHWWQENRSLQQTDYIFDDNGSLLVDFVGRFEFLEEDFKLVCKQIGINAKLPFINQAIFRQKNYKEFYTDQLIDKAGQLLESDIKLGYTFGTSLSDPIIHPKSKTLSSRI